MFDRDYLGALRGILTAKRMTMRLMNFGSQSVRVLIYHHVPKSYEALFRAQVEYLQRQYALIAPDALSQAMAGEALPYDRCAMISFDDGFRSQGRVAENILNPLGVKALFFLAPGYMECSGQEHIRSFQDQSLDLHDIDREGGDAEGLYPMSAEDVVNLLNKGHSIGAHTHAHSKLSKLTELADIQREIYDSGDFLAERFGVPIDHFAFPFGDISSISEESLRHALSRYRCVYSGIRGDNIVGSSRRFIYRDSVRPKFSNSYLGFIIEGGLDLRYRTVRKRMAILLRDAEGKL